MSNNNKNGLPKVIEPEILEPTTMSDGNSQLKGQVALELSKLLIDVVQTGCSVWEKREDVASRWETVRQQIALIDKEGEKEIRNLEHDLKLVESRTKKLQMILDTYARLDKETSLNIAASIGKAIEQLTLG